MYFNNNKYNDNICLWYQLIFFLRIPVDSLKNANTVNIESLSTDDTLNSNNAWQHNTETGQ